MLTIHLNLPHVKAGLIGPKFTITLLTSSRIISVYVCVCGVYCQYIERTIKRFQMSSHI